MKDGVAFQGFSNLDNHRMPVFNAYFYFLFFIFYSKNCFLGVIIAMNTIPK